MIPSWKFAKYKKQKLKDNAVSISLITTVRSSNIVDLTELQLKEQTKSNMTYRGLDVI